ncbi:MAG: hypothetical protein ABFR62_05805 [Bacteroidota bacterium]
MLRRIFFIAIIALIYSCKSDSVYLPDIAVDEYVYINNPSNIKLQSPGGWAYHKGGIKGLIIYRTSSEKFKAYDRACPHISPNTCSILNVEDDIIAKCECDEKTFLLVTGEPIDGASHGLKEYRAYYDPSNETVHIVN